VRAPDLLLAFDDELQIDGRRAGNTLPRLDREELRDKVPFRVPAAARIELPLLDDGVERIPLPLVERVHRLHIVVLVHEEGWLPLAHAELRKHDRGPTLRRVLARLEAVLLEDPPDECRGLRLGALVRGDRREAAILLEDLKRLLRVRLDTGEDIT